MTLTPRIAATAIADNKECEEMIAGAVKSRSQMILLRRIPGLSQVGVGVRAQEIHEETNQVVGNCFSSGASKKDLDALNR